MQAFSTAPVLITNSMLNKTLLKLKNLTLVIPSFERQDYLVRQINYWKDKNIYVIILDGSRFPLDLEKSPTAGMIHSCISYFHLPVSLEERLGFVLGRIQTKYAALLSDDEFFLPSSLISCIDYLDANADSVSCKGRALGFMWKDGRVMSREVYPNLSSCLVNSSDPEKRLIQHFSPYQMITLWSVMKADVFLKTIQCIAHSGKYKTAAAAEIQVSLVAAYSGKCKVIDELMWMRSFENKNIWWNDGNLSFADWYLDPENALDVYRFFEAIVHALGCENLSEGDLLVPFRSALEVYCNSCRKPVRTFFVLRLMRLFRRLVSRVLRISDRSWKSFGLSVREMEERQILVSRADLDEVELVVMHHHLSI